MMRKYLNLVYFFTKGTFVSRKGCFQALQLCSFIYRIKIVRPQVRYISIQNYPKVRVSGNVVKLNVATCPTLVYIHKAE